MDRGLTGLSRAATGLVVATWLLLVVGASVRVNGAGLACPDWPLCFGQVVPTIDLGVAFEFGHRVYAGAISLGFLALAGWVWRLRSQLPTWLPAAVGMAGLVLVTQVVLGGLTVLQLLAEWTVASHLLVGNLFLSALSVIALSIRDGNGPRARLGWGRRLVLLTPIFLIPLQLVIGGFVSSSGAGLVCGTFPSCGGGAWFPSFDGLLGLQVTHRLVAWLLLGSAILAMVAGWREPIVAGAARLLALAVALQGVLGAANVLLRLPAEVTLLHTAGAGFVVLTGTALAWKVARSLLPGQ